LALFKEHLALFTEHLALFMERLVSGTGFSDVNRTHMLPYAYEYLNGKSAEEYGKYGKVE
jgi:hypothetical protein